MTNEEFMAKVELGELVDTFASAGDSKDLETMVSCFADDGDIVVYDAKGKEFAHYAGIDEIRKGYRDLLGQYSTLYHHNGQKMFTINGDTATGKVYCQEFLVSMYKSGVGSILDQGTVYEDTYVKVDGKWLIKDRKGYVKWVDDK